MNNWLKKNAVHIGMVLAFIVICFVYFSPVMQGKALAQSDVLQAKATQKEIMEFKAKDGTAPLWTNQMFGGMPTYQIWAKYAYNGASYGIAVVTKAFPAPIGTVLLLLIGAYFLFITLKANPWLAAAGAIAFGFTLYNFVLIAAGHSNKDLAIGFFAPIIASIMITMRGRYLLGGSLTALFLALEIRANHIQMTYYLFLAMLIYVGIELYHAIKGKTLASFGKAIGFLAAAVVLAVAVNTSLLWTTAEYAAQTNRGKSNLTTDEGKKEGMTKDYAYNWSQGVGESFTFLVADLYGGASSIDKMAKPESHTYKAVAENLTQGDPNQTPQAVQQIAQSFNLNQYWGEKPGTSGGYYFGAIICFLFVFGLFIVQNRLKWWILATTILFTLLSFGKNFPLVSDLFYNYFPLYNKFRAVESILAVVGLMVPILAVTAVIEAQSEKINQQVLIKKLTWSAGITGGFALLVALFPTLFFSFTSSTHQQSVEALTQTLQNNSGVAQRIANAVVEDRIGIAKADGLRSLIFILMGFGLIWALITKKLSTNIALGLLAFVVLVDMWQVDKRYLNSDNFKSKADLANYYQPRDVDKFIMADKDPHFRVYDQTINTFSDASVSTFHKTIGGYHAAKLKRYDELIQNQFNGSINQDVLDMLNARYFILQNQQNGAVSMQRNATALGNAWIIKSVLSVKNSDEEMKAINSFDPKNVAVVDEQYKKLLDTTRLGADPSAYIKMVNYHPDHIQYEYSAPRDILAVFSEIYYDKGWNMYVDGVKKPYFRANYVLRAAQLEAGNHKVEFKFEPKAYYLGEKISLASSVLLVGFLGLAFYTENKKKKLA